MFSCCYRYSTTKPLLTIDEETQTETIIPFSILDPNFIIWRTSCCEGGPGSYPTQDDKKNTQKPFLKILSRHYKS